MEQNEFFVERTDKSPEIKGNMDEGVFSITGISIPEDSREFFIPFRNWLLEFVNSSAAEINVTVDLEYFNTSTSSILLDIFKHLHETSNKKPVSITWLFDEDDLDMEEAGEDYQMMIGDIISIKPKKFDL